MNSKTYHDTAKQISKKLNDFFSDFCDQYPQYESIKNDYVQKKVHLNGVQFCAGFLSGAFDNWEDYIEIAVAIELIMLWAYRTKGILDDKEESHADVKATTLGHDLMLSCMNDLLEQYEKKELRSAEKIRALITEMTGKLSYGFWVEKEKLTIGKLSQDEVLENWGKYYVERNNSLDLVYDYTPLIGYALSTANFAIIDEYKEEVRDKLRFSHTSQIISDLGNLAEDLANGVVTFPILKMINEDIIQDALSEPEMVKEATWRTKLKKLIDDAEINEELIKISAESFDAHKKFFEEHIENPNPMLLKVFGMLINNKYFDQKVVFEKSPILRNRVVLCNKQGKETGTYDKLKAHAEGKLHKAFSIFIFNSNGEHLLQKRAKSKYHSGGLWSNSCCSHHVSGEKLMDTAKRRLKEEMGISCDLQKRFSFVYEVGAGDLCEHEHDTILVGLYDGDVKPNPSEAEDYKWISTEDLTEDVRENPDSYTPWFRLILERMGCR